MKMCKQHECVDHVRARWCWAEGRSKFLNKFRGSFSHIQQNIAGLARAYLCPMAAIRQPRCPYCLKVFTSITLVNRHISAARNCSKAWQKALNEPQLLARYDTQLDIVDRSTELPVGLDNGEVITAFNPFNDMPDLPVTPIEDNPINQLPPPKHAHHDEARDWYVESYPRPAGVPNSSQKLDT
jgi:hypothetical protein